MKLVIDLPDEVVKWFKGKGFIPIGQYLTVDEAMKKAEPLSDVLDRIKAEIETNLSGEMFDEWGNETRLHRDLMEILDNIGKESEE